MQNSFFKMPRLSERQQLIRHLAHAQSFNAIMWALSEYGTAEECTNFDAFATMSAMAQKVRSERFHNHSIDSCHHVHFTYRYLYRSTKVPKGPPLQDMLPLWVHDCQRFRQSVRVHYPTFCKILAMIEEDAIFHNNSFNRQAPVAVQLAVALERIGTNGNGTCVRRLAQVSGISEGTVCLYTNRVIKALLRHSGRVLQYPNARRRSQISAYFEEKLGVRGCTGVIDGKIRRDY